MLAEDLSNLFDPRLKKKIMSIVLACGLTLTNLLLPAVARLLVDALATTLAVILLKRSRHCASSILSKRN